MDMRPQQPRRPGEPTPAGKPTMPPRRSWALFVVVLLVNFLVVRTLLPDADAPLTVPYTFFKEQVGRGNVRSIYGRGDLVTGRFATPVTYPPPPRRARTARPQSKCRIRGRRQLARRGRAARSPPRCPASWILVSRPS